jgi:hypothetical protein
MNHYLNALMAAVFCLVLIVSAVAGATVSDVSLSRNAFNPSAGETLDLQFRLDRAAGVTVKVFDADGGLIRVLEDGVQNDAGMHRVTWNGLDDSGKPVPDEAYTFTIETDAGVVFDPTTFSGGVVADADDAVFDEEGVLVYKLPGPSRVLVRLGVDGGPMLKTLVDWKPRVQGSITETWDGRDADGYVNLRAHAGFSALITYVTLPDATVITFGNRQESYRDYKLGRGKGRPQKPLRERDAAAVPVLRPTLLVPPAWSRAPRVTMTFPEFEDSPTSAVPTVMDKVNVHINVDPADLPSLLDDQFEVIMFVDNVFFAEAERGHLPLNWRWELKQFPAGERVLTVNIASFRGQVGVVSRKVKLVK